MNRLLSNSLGLAFLLCAAIALAIDDVDPDYTIDSPTLSGTEDVTRSFAVGEYFARVQCDGVSSTSPSAYGVNLLVGSGWYFADGAGFSRQTGGGNSYYEGTGSITSTNNVTVQLYCNVGPRRVWVRYWRKKIVTYTREYRDDQLDFVAGTAPAGTEWGPWSSWESTDFVSLDTEFVSLRHGLETHKQFEVERMGPTLYRWRYRLGTFDPQPETETRYYRGSPSGWEFQSSGEPSGISWGPTSALISQTALNALLGQSGHTSRYMRLEITTLDGEFVSAIYATGMPSGSTEAVNGDVFVYSGQGDPCEDLQVSDYVWVGNYPNDVGRSDLGNVGSATLEEYVTSHRGTGVRPHRNLHYCQSAYEAVGNLVPSWHGIDRMDCEEDGEGGENGHCCNCTCNECLTYAQLKEWGGEKLSDTIKERLEYWGGEKLLDTLKASNSDLVTKLGGDEQERFDASGQHQIGQGTLADLTLNKGTPSYAVPTVPTVPQGGWIAKANAFFNRLKTQKAADGTVKFTWDFSAVGGLCGIESIDFDEQQTLWTPVYNVVRPLIRTAATLILWAYYLYNSIVEVGDWF